MFPPEQGCGIPNFAKQDGLGGPKLFNRHKSDICITKFQNIIIQETYSDIAWSKYQFKVLQFEIFLVAAIGESGKIFYAGTLQVFER